jgi:Kef-type K+ transport system membrane component KefB
MTLDATGRYLLAVAVIILLCHLIGVLLARIGQPYVIGEIVGGLLLGPSGLGYVSPAAAKALFPAGVVSSLNLVAQLGLVVFIFLLGSEVRLSPLRSGRNALALVVLASMGLPFVGGLGVGVAGRRLIAGTAGQPQVYLLFVALALAITALPVLARILVDLHMEGTTAGVLALAGAACGDGIMWAVLSVLLDALGARGGQILVRPAVALGLVVFTIVAVRPLLDRLVRRLERTPRAEQVLVPVLIAGAIGYGIVTSSIGLDLIIGAFLFGTAGPRGSAVVARVHGQMQSFTVVLLLPLFFAGIGLKVSVGLLGTSRAAWLFFVLVLFVAAAGKIAGGAGGARLAGLPARDAIQIGILMNCRGVTELVVAAIGWQYHLINALGLTVLTLVALITTAATAPLLALTRRGVAEVPDGAATGAGLST